MPEAYRLKPDLKSWDQDRTVLKDPGFVLRDLFAFSYEDIVAILDLDLGTVKSKIHRGRKLFQKVWEDEIHVK